MPTPVRTNRSTQHWTMQMTQLGADGKRHVTTTGTVVSALRSQTWGANDTPMPEVPPPAAVERLSIGPARAQWVHEYEMRPIIGSLPSQWDGSGEASETRMWVRDARERKLDFAALAALSDSFYPRVWLRRAKPVPIGTVSITTYFHAEGALLAEVGHGYLLGRAVGQQFHNGYFDQAVQLWSEAGALLATSNQIVYFNEPGRVGPQETRIIMNKSVDFYFDFGSPAAYLAYTQLPHICADTGAALVWKPILLGGVFQATGNRSPAEVAAKGRYMNEDLKRFARRYQVQFKYNPHFPINTLLLMRGATGLQMREPERLGAYVDAVFHAMWVEPRDLNDPATVGAVLQAAGFEPAALLALANAQETKDRLKSDTQEAVARGLFGAPTMFVGEQMFWGQDRLDFVREALS